MADREYLVSMIQRAVNGTSRYWAGLIADYLIAHDVMPVVRCEDCVLHGHCRVEDTFEFATMENPFCCAGKWRDDK